MDLHLRAPRASAASSSSSGPSTSSSSAAAPLSSTPLSHPSVLGANGTAVNRAAAGTAKPSPLLKPREAAFEDTSASRLSLDGSSHSSHDAGNGSELDDYAAFAAEAHERDIEQLEESVRQTRTIDEFTAIIGQFRSERRRRSRGLRPTSATSALLGRPASMYSYASGTDAEVASMYGDSSVNGGGGGDDAASIITTRSAGGYRVQVRCTCCCGAGPDECERAKRATSEWADMESDLRLAAEIGQALLRRNDVLVAESSSTAAKHVAQRDSLMSRLTASIKESSGLERQLAQCNLNLEAADSSNRALLHELDEVRGETTRLKARATKNVGLEEKLTRLHQELEDVRQEAAAEHKRAEHAEARARKAGARNTELGESLRAARLEAETSKLQRERSGGYEVQIKAARERLRESLVGEARPSTPEPGSEVMSILEGLVADNEAQQNELTQLRAMLEERNEEVAKLREEALHSYASPTSHTSALPSIGEQRRGSSRPSSALGFRDSYRMPSSLTDTHGSDDRPMNMSDLDHDHRPGPPTPLSEETVLPSAPSSATVRPLHLRSASRSSVMSGSTVASMRERAQGVRSASAASNTFPSRFTDQASTVTPETTVAGDDASSVAASESRLPAVSVSTPTTDTFASSTSAASAQGKLRDTRTAQLVVLLEYVQRIFTRLSSADVDTLSRRLQRQHLTGDVGHLARTTVNGIMREVDGLRDHFRRLIEVETRAALRDDVSTGSGAKDKESESQLSRKEFFALVKMLRDIFFEMARLRNTINEVHLNPANAAKILAEQLGVEAAEDKGVGAWIGRLFSAGVPGAVAGAAPGVTGPTGASSGTGGSIAIGSAKPAAPGRTPSTTGRPPSRSSTAALAPRASAAVTSTAVAVEFKGSHTGAAAMDDALSVSPRLGGSAELLSSSPVGATLQAGPRPQIARGRGSLTRIQSKNLSGLFAGSRDVPGDLAALYNATGGGAGGNASGLGIRNAPLRNPALDRAGVNHASNRLSRIVDDDELSIHQGFVPERTLRPRGLSDSSIRSTFLDQGAGGSGITARPPPMSRLITPSTLALQTSSAGASGRVSSTLPDSPAMSEDSTSTSGAATTAKRSAIGGFFGGLALPSLRPATSQAALSLAAAHRAPSATASRSPSGSTTTSATSPGLDGVARMARSPGRTASESLATPATPAAPIAATRKRDASASRTAKTDEYSSSLAAMGRGSASRF